MTRAALRKPQHELFAPGPAAAMRAQPKAVVTNELFDPVCEAPGCAAKAAYGFGCFKGVRGRWFCSFHKHLGIVTA